MAARHIVELGEHTTPEQFGSMLKLAVCPLIQLKIPLYLCSPADLKFNHECLTPEEYFEERKHMLNTKVSQAKVAELFAVHPKKLHRSCSGCKYNPGKKPSKNKVTDNTTMTKQKLDPTPEDKSEATLSETPQEEENLAIDDNDDTLPDPFESIDTDEMPMLVSDSDGDASTKGMKEKQFIHKKPTKSPIRKK